jgi:hypothetical protein
MDAHRLRPGAESSQNISAFRPDAATPIIRLPVIAGLWLAQSDQAAVVANDAFTRDEPDVRVGDSIVFKIAGRETPLTVVGIVRDAMAPAAIYLNEPFLAKVVGDSVRVDRLWLTTDSAASLD